MMPGNQARELLDNRNTSVITELISNVDRRVRVQEVLSIFYQLRTMYRAHDPVKEEIVLYKKRAVHLGELFRENFVHVSWPNYLHKIIEHVQEILDDPNGPGSIGAMSFSRWFYFRKFRESNPREKFPLQFMSIYSNDNIRKIAKLTTRELPHLAKTAKITVRENNGVYSNYFASRHGKGPSDGESAVVKMMVSTAVNLNRHP